jgi:acetyl-CoA carboxylase carboxyltransferase component
LKIRGKIFMVSDGQQKQSTAERLEEMDKRSELGGGAEKITEQHKKGKKTARERIALLLDENSFVETDRFAMSQTGEYGPSKKHYGDGVVTGYGTIEGRTVFVFAHDFTVYGGSLGVMFGKKIAKVMDLALKAGAPIIGLSDSGGARIQEGVQSLAAYSEIFFRNTMCSGVIPQISLILGPCAGGAVYSPAMTDFVLMTDKTSYMFITGPDVVRAALGQKVSFEELGGANVGATRSGVAHFIANSEEDAFSITKRLLSFLPSSNSETPPKLEPSDDPNRTDESLESVVPNDSNKAYDMKKIVETILDDNDFFEIHALWAPNIIVGFGRLDGDTVGVVANQPTYLAGALDINSSSKAARFIRFCDAFSVPVVTFVDVPGYMPGTEQEHGGIIRHGSKLLYAYCEATVPKVTVIVRKAYGGAYCAMGSKFSRADLNFAWPSAEIAVMGPEGAANIIHRHELEKTNDARTRQRLVKEYRDKYANPFIAAETGIIDAVIHPRDTRRQLIKALSALAKKSEQRPQKKHGNIQL